MTLGWILAASVAGGTLSAALAAFALYLRASWIPMLVSFAIGALLVAAFLEVIPHAMEHDPRHAAAAILAGRDDLTTLVKELAMQIAAASPTYVSREAIPADVLEKERAIYRAQMEGSGKPAGVIDKIVEGKLGSFYAQVVLTEQPSIRDPKTTVKDLIAGANKALGAALTVNRFARLKVGETG